MFNIKYNSLSGVSFVFCMCNMAVSEMVQLGDESDEISMKFYACIAVGILKNLPDFCGGYFGCR